MRALKVNSKKAFAFLFLLSEILGWYLMKTFLRTNTHKSNWNFTNLFT